MKKFIIVHYLVNMQIKFHKMNVKLYQLEQLILDCYMLEIKSKSLM